MTAGRLLREARHRAKLSQRELAARGGVAQPTVARIESGAASPRVETLERLLSVCGASLAVVPAGAGVDRTQIRAMLRLTPRQRLELLRDDAAGLRRLEHARRR
jgi:transcriptional regulator with XRE-family HTH domain